MKTIIFSNKTEFSSLPRRSQIHLPKTTQQQASTASAWRYCAPDYLHFKSLCRIAELISDFIPEKRFCIFIDVSVSGCCFVAIVGGRLWINECKIYVFRVNIAARKQLSPLVSAFSPSENLIHGVWRYLALREISSRLSFPCFAKSRGFILSMSRLCLATRLCLPLSLEMSQHNST